MLANVGQRAPKLRYFGCYKDHHGDRRLLKFLYNPTSGGGAATPRAECAQACFDLGFEIMGMEYLQQCRCGGYSDYLNGHWKPNGMEKLEDTIRSQNKRLGHIFYHNYGSKYDHLTNEVDGHSGIGDGCSCDSTNIGPWRMCAYWLT